MTFCAAKCISNFLEKCDAGGGVLTPKKYDVINCNAPKVPKKKEKTCKFQPSSSSLKMVLKRSEAYFRKGLKNLQSSKIEKLDSNTTFLFNV